MTRFVSLVAMTAGGWAGWWLGAHVGLMTAFFVGLVGSALGMWGANVMARHYLR